MQDKFNLRWARNKVEKDILYTHKFFLLEILFTNMYNLNES